VSFGIGHGSSFPWLSSATGRPAIEDSFTVEVTGKDCCPATLGTTAALRENAIKTLAIAVARVISLHGNNRKKQKGCPAHLSAAVRTGPRCAAPECSSFSLCVVVYEASWSANFLPERNWRFAVSFSDAECDTERRRETRDGLSARLL
jgi:hypothetical protein